MNAEIELVKIFADSSFMLLVGLLVGSIFFIITALRSLREDHMEGSLYGAVGLFFAAAHVYYLLNIPPDSQAAFVIPVLNLWSWLVLLFAPALVALFLLYTLINWIMARSKAGFFSLFFGLTLACLIFLIGKEWALDIRGILVATWAFFFFAVQLETAF